MNLAYEFLRLVAQEQIYYYGINSLKEFRINNLQFRVNDSKAQYVVQHLELDPFQWLEDTPTKASIEFTVNALGNVAIVIRSLDKTVDLLTIRSDGTYTTAEPPYRKPEISPIIDVWSRFDERVV